MGGYKLSAASVRRLRKLSADDRAEPAGPIRRAQLRWPADELRWVCVEPVAPAGAETITTEGEHFRVAVRPDRGTPYSDSDAQEFDLANCNVFRVHDNSYGWMAPGNWFLAQWLDTGDAASTGWYRVSAGASSCFGTYRASPARIEVSATDVRDNVATPGWGTPTNGALCAALWDDDTQQWRIIAQPCA